MSDHEKWHQCLYEIMEPNRIQSPSSSASLEKIVDTILSGKYRRSASDEASIRDIREKVGRCIAEEVSIEFSVPFGGYKSWHEPCFPLPNWAEMFSVAYLREYLLRVAMIFPWGIRVSYSYTGGVMDIVSNLPQEKQNIYLNEFSKILEHYSDDSVSFNLVDIATLYGDKSEMYEELFDNFRRIMADWNQLLPASEQEKKLASAKRNFLINGCEDFRHLTVHEIDLKRRRSAMLCDALDSLKLRRKFNKYSERIQLVFVRGPVPSVHIGSCKTSSNHFWVATGILEKKEEKIRPRIETSRGIKQKFLGKKSLIIDVSDLANKINIPSLEHCTGFVI